MCSLVNGTYRGKKLKLEAEKLLELRPARDQDPASPFRGKEGPCCCLVCTGVVCLLHLFTTFLVVFRA